MVSRCISSSFVRSRGFRGLRGSRDQAEIGYRQAEGFVQRSPRLSEFLRCQEGYRRIKNLTTGGRIQVFAADDKTGDGVIPTDAFLDELHRQKDLRLYRTWRGKLGKRGGQMATISTAGEPGTEFEETRELIRRSVPLVERRPGFALHRNEQISFHEWAVRGDEDTEDMRVVKAANPFSRITVAALQAEAGLADDDSAALASVRVQHRDARRHGRAVQEEAEWEAARTDEQIPVGDAIWLGLDVGWKWDTTALVPLWVPEHGQADPR